MAITVHSTPASYTPSDNPVTWVFSSDQTGQANFSFVIEVHINGTSVGEHLVFPEVGSRAHFDASEIASIYCDHADRGQSGFSADAANHKQVRLKIQERYGDPATIQGTNTTAEITAFKARLPDDEWESWDHTVYKTDSGTQFMTDFPTAEDFLLQSDEIAYLSIIADGSSVDVKVELFDASDASIVSDTKTFASPGRINMFDVSQSAIAGEYASISSGDFTSASYYIITTTKTANDISFTITIDRTSEQYPHFRFLFLNTLGGIDSWTFTMLSRKRRQITRRTFERQYGGWVGTDYEYSSAAGRTLVTSTTTVPSIIVNSDWLDEDVQQWLAQQMYESVRVWMYDGADTVAVNVMTRGYELKTHKNDMLVNEMAEVDISNYRKSMVV